MTQAYNPDYLIENFPGKYETGDLTFNNPLVVEAGGGYGEVSNWKRRIHSASG